jgi:hypothetical protein
VEASLKEKVEMIMRRVLLLILFSAGLMSCRKESENPVPDLGLDYYPIAVGDYRIYRLDSLFFNDFTSKVDTFQFEVKEVVSEEYTDGSDKQRFRIERYYRKRNTEPWAIADVWSAYRSTQHAVQNEENLEIVKLSFPVRKGRSWNRNMFNASESQECNYTFLDSSVSRSGLSFEKSLRITLPGDSNLIFRKFSFEEYAKGVGMTYKRFVSVEDRDSVIDFSKPFNARVDFGYDVTYTLIEYGKN